MTQSKNVRFLIPMRRVIHGAFLFYCLYIGYQFQQFFTWAITNEKYTPRPPSIEAFLPIGALVSCKQFMLTGRYEVIHPAGLTTFITFLLLSFFFRKGFCGWICPVGFTSELISKCSDRFKTSLPKTQNSLQQSRLSRGLHYCLVSIKYLVLGFFLYAVCWKMDRGALENFIYSSYNITSDARMLLFFFNPSKLTLVLLGVLVVFTLLLRNFWCRFLCPYGALLGLLALASPLQLSRNEQYCIHCGKCEIVCPASVKITDKKQLINTACIGCLECTTVCPKPDCLNLTFYFQRKISHILLPAGLLLCFFVAWLTAEFTGHWHSSLSDETFKHFYQILFR